MSAAPFLTIVTVVYNDWPGLSRTLESVTPHRSADVEHWIIDGSTDGKIYGHLNGALPERTYLLSEPDAGLYDAMNKGLDRATGRYTLFLNAGDELQPQFSLPAVQHMAGEDNPLLLGYSIEQWGRDGYLRPGLGREPDALAMPAHQATFYPRAYYSSNRYDLSRPIGADGKYTAAAARECGAVFIPVLVCRFELGGRSTRYDRAAIRARFREYASPRVRAQVLVKAAMWALLPQRWFYRLLAAGKFTRLTGRHSFKAGEAPITLLPV